MATEVYPIVSKYLKQHMLDYYCNTFSSFLWRGDMIKTENFFFEVLPTSEQIKNLKDNFQNKSPYGFEIYLDRYLLNILEEFDRESEQKFYSYRLVFFIVGKVYCQENICNPNILSNDYLTATYYKINGLDLNPRDYIDSVLPIRLTNEQTIYADPKDIIFTENNLPFPNSTRTVKVRTGNISLPGAYPEGESQPGALTFVRDENLISIGGVSLYNINTLAICLTVSGVSTNTLRMIESL